MPWSEYYGCNVGVVARKRELSKFIFAEYHDKLKAAGELIIQSLRTLKSSLNKHTHFARSIFVSLELRTTELAVELKWDM